jgi:NADPH:quinone reductase-like Zn-dependent oxidoreductase
MQALTLTRFEKKNCLGGIALQTQAAPIPQAHQVLVRIKAAAFNPADLHIASGEMKMMSPVKPPFVLGVDGAGVIEQVGSSARGFAVGDAVFFYTGLVFCGTVGEYAVVDAQALARKPEGWSFEHAAASALALLCANLSLSRAGVKTGQRVLVHGGGGAVGSAAIVLARARGAEVDTTASASDAAYLHSLGASTVFDYKTQPLSSLPQAAYDMVLDGMGGAMFLQSLPLIRQGGTIASLKVMTGLDDMLRMGMKVPGLFNLLMPLMFRRFTKAAAKAGVHVAGVATYQDGSSLQTLADRAVALGYDPRIAQTFPLNQANAALAFFASGKAKGKVVVTI